MRDNIQVIGEMVDYVSLRHSLRILNLLGSQPFQEIPSCASLSFIVVGLHSIFSDLGWSAIAIRKISKVLIPLQVLKMDYPLRYPNDPGNL